MLPKAKTVYFHVDVNSAFLSWTAIQHLANGETLDLRTVPAVVGGDEEKRHGVVLAKSIPAKRYGIQTGESLFMARSKYPNLIVAAPDFDWYVKNSKAMIRIFGDYTPDIEQYSIDEAFLNMTGSEGLFGPPLQAAQTIKDRIHRELGFTVNIGIAPNRLLAKMASDFEKPDKIHVLTQDMVPQKLWPLPVGNLFGVGPKSVKRMHEIGIYTIGDLANADADILRGVFGVRGQVFRDYAADPARIQHFIKVHSFAALIARQEGMDAATLEILEAAAYVHDIGIKPAEQTYGSSAGRYQEELGPAPAHAMMLECGFTPAQADRVAYLVGHHHTYTNIDGMDYQILVEADFLVNLYEDSVPKAAAQNALDKIFKTQTGKTICKEMFVL